MSLYICFLGCSGRLQRQNSVEGNEVERRTLGRLKEEHKGQAHVGVCIIRNDLLNLE